jgi:hypothetical protein
MDYQKNLHTNRIGVSDTSDNWTHVTLNSRFYPARYKFSMDAGLYSVACVEIEPRQQRDGRSSMVAKPDVLHFRSATVDGLKEAISKSFPQAIFSSSAPQQTDSIRAAYQQERENEPADAKEIADAWEKLRKQFGTRNANGIQELIPGTKFTEQQCTKIGIRRGVYLALSRQAEQDEINLLTNAARQLVAEQTPEQQERWLGAHLQDFVDNGYTDHPEWGWKEWFRAHPRFFQWPDKTGWNRNQLLKYCRAHGSGYIPTILELCQGMKFLLDRRTFFAMKETYKRSEQFERDALQDYRGDEYVPPTFSPAQIKEASKQLEALMPAGMRPNQEFMARAAKQSGISDQLLYIILHPSEQPKPQLAGKSAIELKKDLQAMRPPVNPADRRKGW